MKILVSMGLCGIISVCSWSQTGFEYPLALSAPYHLDTIDNKRPTLIWQGDLTAVLTDPRVDMFLVLVEKKSGQSISEALIMNTPLYSGYGLKDLNFPFPSSVEDLLSGHTYAWQVQMRINGMPATQSEQWEFTIRDLKRDESQYIKLTTGVNNTVYKIRADYVCFVIEDKGIQKIKGRLRKVSDGNTTYALDDIKKTNTNRDFGYYRARIDQLNLKEGNYVLELWADNMNYVMQFYFEK